MLWHMTGNLNCNLELLRLLLPGLLESQMSLRRMGAGTFTLGYFTLGRFTPRFYFLRTFSTQEIFICGHITLTFFHLWNKSS